MPVLDLQNKSHCCIVFFAFHGNIVNIGFCFCDCGCDSRQYAMFVRSHNFDLDFECPANMFTLCDIQIIFRIFLSLRDNRAVVRMNDQSVIFFNQSDNDIAGYRVAALGKLNGQAFGAKNGDRIAG